MNIEIRVMYATSLPLIFALPALQAIFKTASSEELRALLRSDSPMHPWIMHNCELLAFIASNQRPKAADVAMTDPATYRRNK